MEVKVTSWSEFGVETSLKPTGFKLLSELMSQKGQIGTQKNEENSNELYYTDGFFTGKSGK